MAGKTRAAKAEAPAPENASVVILTFADAIAEAHPDYEPPDLADTAGSDDLENRRGYALATAVVKTFAPMALIAAGQSGLVLRLANLPDATDHATVKAAWFMAGQVEAAAIKAGAPWTSVQNVAGSTGKEGAGRWQTWAEWAAGWAVRAEAWSDAEALVTAMVALDA